MAQAERQHPGDEDSEVEDSVFKLNMVAVVRRIAKVSSDMAIPDSSPMSGSTPTKLHCPTKRERWLSARVPTCHICE